VAEGRAPTLRFETALVSFCLACWLLAGMHFLGLLELGGRLELSLYAYYSSAAALGWLSGNVFLIRRKKFPGTLHARLGIIFLLAPPGLIFLLWALTPRLDQGLAPLVPAYAFGVYTVLFLVPILLRRVGRVS
jgi:hypothetical protein